MPITTDIDRGKNVTVFKITGRVPFDDFGQAMLDYYESGATEFVILISEKQRAQGRHTPTNK